MSDALVGYFVIIGGFIAFIVGLVLLLLVLSWIGEHILEFISLMLVLIFLVLVF